MLSAGSVARAADLKFLLDLPADRPIKYQIDLEVEHGGSLVLEADWSDHRVLAFRLVSPRDDVTPLRLSGPPPVRASVEIPQEYAGDDAPWKLSVFGLPARDRASGQLNIDLPRPPQPGELPAAEEASSGPEPAAWRQPLPAYRGGAPEWRRIYASTEALRRLVVEGPPDDNFRWQDDFLRYLADGRQRQADGKPVLSDSTRRMFGRIVDAVRKTEALRSSDDPVLNGKPPRGKRRLGWESARADYLVPLELELDDMLRDLHRGHAPELAYESWAARLLSCMIVCERYFEQRVRLGEKKAKGRDVAEHQWPRILAASTVLADLADLPTPRR